MTPEDFKLLDESDEKETLLILAGIELCQACDGSGDFGTTGAPWDEHMFCGWCDAIGYKYIDTY